MNTLEPITDQQIDTIEHAAALLDGYAIRVKGAGAEDAQGVYDDMKATSADLYTIADAVRTLRAEFILTQTALINAQSALAKPRGNQ